MTAPPTPPSVLATRRGKLTLAVLCAVAFLDFVDASIVNIALPAIRADLHMSVQSLQWVPSGYLLTYGGLMLLGGRAADLLGRRRVLVTGTVLFAAASLAGGLAGSSGVLIGARLAQGAGAAMMLPAALSILTTTFREGADRPKALGAWGGMAGLGSAAGVLLGGVLTQSSGWRWVFLVKPPLCLLVLAATLWLIRGDRRRAPLANFDILGAVLSTAGTLAAGLRAGTRARRRLGIAAHHRRASWRHRPVRRVRRQRAAQPEPAAAAVHLPDQGARGRGRHPADWRGRVHRDVLLPHPVHARRPRLLTSPHRPGLPAGHRRRRARRRITPRLVSRIGTRPVFVAGALIAAGGIYWLARVPVHGSYLTAVLPGMLIMSIGLGAEFVAATTAANAGVPPDKAGLAAALFNASQQNRRRARAGRLLRHRHRPHHPPAGRSRSPARCARRGLPPRAAGRQHLPARRRLHRAAHHQHPRRAQPYRPGATAEAGPAVNHGELRDIRRPWTAALVPKARSA